MSASISTQLLRAELEVPCPACSYPLWVRYAEIVVQAAVTCPCCYTRVWLRDDRGSARNAGDVIEQHLRDALKGFS